MSVSAFPAELLEADQDEWIELVPMGVYRGVLFAIPPSILIWGLIFWVLGWI